MHHPFCETGAGSEIDIDGGPRLGDLLGQGGERRMVVVETLMLDPARRLVLVRIDDEERLLILGEGRELVEPRGPGAGR